MDRAVITPNGYPPAPVVGVSKAVVARHRSVRPSWIDGRHREGAGH
jgi:hypothetical protein